MKIKIYGYPKTFTFETSEALPAFDKDQFSFPVRTEIFRKAVADVKHNAPHADDDFFVEQVIPTRTGGEIWSIGS